MKYLEIRKIANGYTVLNVDSYETMIFTTFDDCLEYVRRYFE